MSQYAINKFMRLVNMDADELAAYRAEPAGFAAAFAADNEPRGFLKTARGAPLTAEEYEAFATRDYAALYRMGAHPYLLWSFTEAVWVPELDRSELVKRFRDSAAAAGYPNFATTTCPPAK